MLKCQAAFSLYTTQTQQTPHCQLLHSSDDIAMIQPPEVCFQFELECVLGIKGVNS